MNYVACGSEIGNNAGFVRPRCAMRCTVQLPTSFTSSRLLLDIAAYNTSQSSQALRPMAITPKLRPRGLPPQPQHSPTDNRSITLSVLPHWCCSVLTSPAASPGIGPPSAAPFALPLPIYLSVFFQARWYSRGYPAGYSSYLTWQGLAICRDTRTIHLCDHSLDPNPPLSKN